jgi:hypothetical protein
MTAKATTKSPKNPEQESPRKDRKNQLDRELAGAPRRSFSLLTAARRIAPVETLGGKLRLYFLPPYAPDRNSDELGVVHQFEIPFLYGPSYCGRRFDKSNYCKQTEKILLTVRVHTPRFVNRGRHAIFWSGFFPLRMAWCFASEITSQNRRASSCENLLARVGQQKVWHQHPAHDRWSKSRHERDSNSGAMIWGR